LAPEYRPHSVARTELEKAFPSLQIAEWKITSPIDRAYNCHAWGVCESRVRWEPTPDDYWPPGLRTDTISDYCLDNFIRAYNSVGFCKCPDGRYEFGFQKIAIYSQEDYGEEWPQHTARQTLFGRAWLSKMGDGEDITHRCIRDLEGQMYGRVICYMKRRWLRALANKTSRWVSATLRHWVYRRIHPDGI
jgi:hypothetical protein